MEIEIDFYRGKIESPAGNQAGLKPLDSAGDKDLEKRLLNREIAERHKELRLFKESESYFRQLINSAPVALLMTDTNGKCLYANESWCLLSGMTRQQSIGKGWQKAVHPEDVAKIGSWWYRGEKKGTDPGTECRICSPDGGLKWADLKAAPLYDNRGVLVGFVASFTDITHRRKNPVGPIDMVLD